MVRWISEKARTDGAISESEATAWLDDLRRLGEDDAYFFCVNRFLFTAVRI